MLGLDSAIPDVNSTIALAQVVFGGVHVQGLQFLHLLLEESDMIHEGHDSVRGHRGRVKPGGGEERSHVERHGALRSVQNEQFTPGEV